MIELFLQIYRMSPDFIKWFTVWKYTKSTEKSNIPYFDILNQNK